jgi:hypothetical protein
MAESYGRVSMREPPIWVLEVVDLTPKGDVAKRHAWHAIGFTGLDNVKAVARQRMRDVIDHDQAGQAVRLVDPEGNEQYRWDREDDRLIRARAEEIEARRPGKNRA